MKWPLRVAPGTETDFLGAFWDVYPTIADIINTATAGEPVDGISFLPTLLGNVDDQRQHESLYWEFHEHGGKQALIQGEWKVIRLGAIQDRQAPIELYNLKKDPGEVNNLAEDLPEKAKAMTQLLDSVRTPNDHFNFGD